MIGASVETGVMRHFSRAGRMPQVRRSCWQADASWALTSCAGMYDRQGDMLNPSIHAHHTQVALALSLLGLLTAAPAAAAPDAPINQTAMR